MDVTSTLRLFHDHADDSAFALDLVACLVEERAGASTGGPSSPARSDEPVPRRQPQPDANVVEYWRNRTRALTPGPLQLNTAALSPPRPRSMTAGAKPGQRRRRIDVVGDRASRVRRACDAAKDDSAFWKNRLHLLKREMERAQQQLDAVRLQSSKAEVATVLSETVEAQLDLERHRASMLKQEKRDHIQAQNLEHRIALRQSQQSLFQTKHERSRGLKADSRRADAALQQTRVEVLQRKSEVRATVQRQKVQAMVLRVRDVTMKREASRRSYEAHISAVEETTATHQTAMLTNINESSNMVERIRRLKALRAQAVASNSAFHALNSSLYREQ
jgi:hypothetical protein